MIPSRRWRILCRSSIEHNKKLSSIIQYSTILKCDKIYEHDLKYLWCFPVNKHAWQRSHSYSLAWFLRLTGIQQTLHQWRCRWCWMQLSYHTIYYHRHCHMASLYGNCEDRCQYRDVCDPDHWCRVYDPWPCPPPVWAPPGHRLPSGTSSHCWGLVSSAPPRWRVEKDSIALYPIPL